jgi:DNA-binding MarR family transcriptional regulator
LGGRAWYLRSGRDRQRCLRRSRRDGALIIGDEATRREPDFEPEHRVGHLLRRAYHRAKQHTSAALRDVGITPMQAAAIMALRRDGALSQAALGRAIGMEPANVHGLIARLRASGMIEAVPHPTDQRSVRITLSAAGVHHADDIAQVSAAAQEATLAPLAPGEQAMLLELLGRIVSSTMEP